MLTTFLQAFVNPRLRTNDISITTVEEKRKLHYKGLWPGINLLLEFTVNMALEININVKNLCTF